MPAHLNSRTILAFASISFSRFFSAFWVIPRNKRQRAGQPPTQTKKKGIKRKVKKNKPAPGTKTNLERAINNMVDNLKSCDLQAIPHRYAATQTDALTDTNANECRSHYGTPCCCCCCSYQIHFLCIPTLSESSQPNPGFSFRPSKCCGHCYAGMPGTTTPRPGFRPPL